MDVGLFHKETVGLISLLSLVLGLKIKYNNKGFYCAHTAGDPT